MSRILETASRTAHPFLHSLSAGALVGGLFGIADTFVRPEHTSLPLTSQLLVVGINWYVAAMAGLAAALAFHLASIVLGRPRRGDIERFAGPVFFSLAACAWITVIQASYLRAVLATALAAITFVIFIRLARTCRWLSSVSLWGFLNSAGLIGLACWITIHGPLAHGVEAIGAAVFLPAVILALLGFLVPLSRTTRRYGIAVSVPVLAFLGVSWFVTPLLQPGRTAAEGPNVLLITVDTLRDDHLGCYGNEWIRTPHIDRLADEGVLFENTICSIPLTNPSHSTILTGLHPAGHGVLLNEPAGLRSGVTTLSEILAARGYRTAAFVSGVTLKRQACCLIDHFQVYDDDFSPAWVPEPCVAGSFARVFFRLSHHVSFLPHGYTPLTERSAELALNGARKWLAANADTPFFLWLHFFDPHGPYTPPPPYHRLYDPDYTGSVDGRWYGMSLEEKQRVIDSPREQEHLKALYAGEVSYVDEQIGKLRSEMERLNLSDRTLVIFAADHGESLTEHDYYFDHSVCLYDPSLKVPLIIRFPDGSAAGRRRPEVVQLVDVAPTLLDIMGIRETGPVDGISLKDLCLGESETSERGPAISAILPGEIAGGKSLLSIRTARHKYIRTSPWFGDRLRIPASEEMYDLEDDPGETRNIIDSGVEGLEEYRTLADEYWDTWHQLEVEKSGPIAEGVRERLRALGYLQ